MNKKNQQRTFKECWRSAWQRAWQRTMTPYFSAMKKDFEELKRIFGSFKHKNKNTKEKREEKQGYDV